MIGYAELRKEQAEKRARGELMGIGISTFTEIVGAGPSQALRHPRASRCSTQREIRIHPTGKAIARFGTKSQGQGHETTYAQIVAEELGIPADDIQVEEGDTDTAPYGLGTYASRSTPTAGAAAADGGAQDPRQGAEDRRAPARGAARTTSSGSRRQVLRSRARPSRSKTIQEIAFAAYTNHPQGMEAGPRGGELLRSAEPDLPLRQLHLRGRHRPRHRRGQGPPLRGGRRLRQHHQPDDRRGPDPRRPDDGPGARRCFEEISYDENGNIQRRQLHGLPACRPRWRRPNWETDKTVTPSPHHPFGAKGVGESATVGAPPAIANAVVDALCAPRRARTSTSRSRRRRCGRS